MTIKQIVYLAFCVFGTVLPYSEFVPFLKDHGLDGSLFLQQLFANPVSGFFGLDVIVSSAVLLVFVYSEGTRLQMRNLWLYVVANLLVGVSLALPMFLLARQGKVDTAARMSDNR